MRAIRGPSRTATGGFTLVEVMLTLLIVSGILLSMTQILTAARTSRDTIHNIQETQLAGPAILDMIERDLRGLTVYNRDPSQHMRVRDRVMLGLDGDSLDFVTTTDSLILRELDDRYVRSDYNEVGYRLRPRQDQDDFLELYRRESFGVDDKPFEEGHFTFLHDRVKSFDIQAFDEDGPDAEPLADWGVDDENGENPGLPTRLEITLTLELAPRIVREQLLIAPVDRRTMVYKRILRMPESLRMARENQPVPTVPAAEAPEAEDPAGGGGQPAGGGGGGGGGRGSGGGGR